MNINPKIFKAYDIRGIYPIDINEENFSVIIKSIFTFFHKKLKKNHLSFVLGRDMRLSSPSLYKIAKKTLIESGADVIDIGLSSTPTVYFCVLHYQYDLGIQISASHNPSQWNGVKFCFRNGKKLTKISKDTGMEDVKQIALSGKFTKLKKKGSIIEKEVLKDEVQYAFSLVKPKHIGKIKVVADAANAMGALYLDEIFSRIPSKLIRMNFTLNGSFPAHQADPLQFKTLRDLQKRVVKEHADLGICPDGDGDRVFFIDEKGAVIPATIITSLVAREILKNKKGEKILFDVRYTRNTINSIKSYGGIPILCKVGHALITAALNKESGAFAGESSGHFYFRETGGAESSIRVILYVLESICREKKPISTIVKNLTFSIESGELNFLLPKNIDLEQFKETLIKKYFKGKVTKFDGLSIDYPEWRFNIRVSNTEGVLRLNVEGKTDKIVETKNNELKNLILNTGATVKE